MLNINIINISDNKVIQISHCVQALSKLMPYYSITNNSCLKNDYSEKIQLFINSYNKCNILWCLNGGTSCIKLLDLNNYFKIKKNISKSDKLIIGNSDNDHLLIRLANDGYNVVNGHNVSKVYEKYKNLKQLNNIISSKPIIISHLGTTYLTKGKIVCGNLQIICMILKHINFKNKVLFVEDHTNQLDMVLYYFYYLKNYGVFNNLKAIVLGKLELISNKTIVVNYLSNLTKIPIIDISGWDYIPNNWICEVKQNELIITKTN